MDAAPPGPELRAHVAASAALAGLSAEAVAALAAHAAVVEPAAGEALYAPEDPEALHLVLAGGLRAEEEGGDGEAVRTLGPGEALDEMLVVAGSGGPLTVRALPATRLLRVHSDDVDALARAHPTLDAARRRLHRRQLLCRLHPLVGPLDGALVDRLEAAAEWLELPRGALLFPQDAAGDRLYFVVSGRVRAVRREADGSERVVGAAGRGESVGEMAFFTGEPRTARVNAVRDSLVVALPHEAFEALVATRPHLLRRLTRSLLQRVNRTAWRDEVVNVAVVAASDGVDAGGFARRLADALGAFGPSLCLGAAEVDAGMCEPGIARTGDDAEATRLRIWLEAREGSHRFVVYEADAGATPWTRRCLSQADRVLLVARADADPAPGATERAIAAIEGEGDDATRPRRALVLLHAADTALPSGTRRWLEARRVDEHHHLRGDGEGEIARLARVLAGRAVGLVLGGGGARGLAHIGVLKALEEEGICVDMVGGTSMGASLAAQWAMGWSAAKIHEVNHRVWVEIRPHQRYTLPVLSIIGAAEAEVCGRMMYGDTEIEDLWIPFFCISSDLATAEMVVHRAGSVLWAATASASLPGAALPVLLGGHLLVDGALLNNLPTDVMREGGAGTVLASEVSVEEDATFACPRIPAPREVLWARLRGRAATVPFPSLMEVALRASMLHSVSRERSNLANADLCFRPEIEGFRLMDFSRLDDLVRVGHAHARVALREHAVAAPRPLPSHRPPAAR